MIPIRSDEEVSRLVESNIGLAHFWCQKFHWLDPDDALSIAMEGLLVAAQEWDERGPFGAYASIRIKWTFSRHHLGTTRKKRGFGAHHVPLDAPIFEDSSTTVGDLMADSSELGAFSALLDKDNASTVLKAVQKLPLRERKIISARFGLSGGDHKTLEEIGLEFAVSKERIRQIETKVLARLRRSLRKRNAITLEGPKHLGRRETTANGASRIKSAFEDI